jgi:HlyD family secretion protein
MSRKKDQNVVSYEGVLRVDNSELLLRPGMTATATIISDERKGVLTIPNAALRFTPPDEGQDNTQLAGGQRRVWVLQDGKPTARTVQTGATDGEYSELMGEELKEGERVLTDVMEMSRDKP